MINQNNTDKSQIPLRATLTTQHSELNDPTENTNHDEQRHTQDSNAFIAKLYQ
jgi:hypothetical protein